MKLFDKKLVRRNKIYFLVFFILSFANIGDNAKAQSLIQAYNPNQFKHEVECIYQQLLSDKFTVTKRIEKVSHFFLGKPYRLGALGEGYEGKFDKNPLFRTDAFDCLTFVSTVLALAESRDYLEFLANLKKIQYRDSCVSYFNRYHFMETDWNIANEKQGFLIDITSDISTKYQMAEALIDKPQWFDRHSESSLKCFNPLSEKTIASLLSIIHCHGTKLTAVRAYTSYIPLTELIEENRGELRVKEELLARIPTGSIVEIVDKNQDYKQKIGTDLNIVHIGFAITTSQGIIFRHASKNHHAVIELPLSQYLMRCYQLASNPERVGIHVERIITNGLLKKLNN